MREQVAIRTARGTEYVGGMRTPVAGLALTQVLAGSEQLGHVCVTHELTGLALGYFADAEPAAAFCLAIGALADWAALTSDTPGFAAVGRAVMAELERCGGTISGWQGDGMPLAATPPA